MITREEFLDLFKKNLSGKCSDAEKALLESYNDEMRLLGEEWQGEETEKQQTGERIWQRINASRNIQQKRPIYRKLYLGSAAAAAILLVISVGIGIYKFSPSGVKIATTETKSTTGIPPGGNKAFLTTANGKKIVLNEVKIGALPSSAGIAVVKTAEGTLVYDTSKTRQHSGPASLEWNTVATPRGGQYQLVLSDGSRVWLNAASSLRFPAAFPISSREVELTGEAYFEIAKNKAKPFTVKTSGTIVRVLGTHFNVNAYQDGDQIKTTLLEGAVQLQHGDKHAILQPGEQGLSSAGGFVIGKADVEEAMAWKNGYFIFRDENITSIMKRVARWYDIEVAYKDDMTDRGFGGTVSRYKDITELLDYMQLTGAIHYKIQGRRVIIMK